MFVAVLKSKTYIAALLTLIFTAKFVAIDANGLNIIFNGSATTFVNPHCKKNDAIDKSNDTSSFFQNDNVESQVIILNGNCTTPFHFELYSWETDYSKPLVDFNNHYPSSLSCRYLDSISPPPRVA